MREYLENTFHRYVFSSVDAIHLTDDVDDLVAMVMLIEIKDSGSVCEGDIKKDIREYKLIHLLR